ncbi:MAG: beta-galactosidase [Candidatus Methylacidiphilales bacterium]|nr:beta-galactosidase [Candidatus Methylacidiphilales bacterium]
MNTKSDGGWQADFNSPEPIRSPLGCQIWVEPGDSPERIDDLVLAARDSGLGSLRIFLLWTWIERRRDEFDFSLYDPVFDAAAKYGLGIKATLTANSGPWHIGTPGVLHSHTGFLGTDQREPMRRYIERCVTRYRNHPALAQWLLWNEPHGANRDRTEENALGWREFLRERYQSEIEKLNQRWLTGYSGFESVPWPEDITHPAHRSGAWLPYRAELDEADYRCVRLVNQLRWIAAEVRCHDPVTELCHNPIFNIENQAGGATDLPALASVVDRMGASYHPVFWHSQVRRLDYASMIAVGVRALATQSEGKPVELTEVMSGNAVYTGTQPFGVTASEIVRFYLGALAAGASSVTGWCLNARHRDSEAGEFALLNDQDGASDRSRALARLRAVLAEVHKSTGTWKAHEPDVFLLLSRKAQAIEMLDARGGVQHPGQTAQESARGQWLLSQRLMEMGWVATHGSFEHVPSPGSAKNKVVLVSHVVAWEKDPITKLLDFAQAGGTVVFDALSGRKDHDSRIHRPWPGALAEATGLSMTGLDSVSGAYELTLDGQTAGRGVLTRTQPATVPGSSWRAWEDCRFACDGSPAVLERTFGHGRMVHVRFPLGPSLLAHPDEDRLIRWMMRQLIVQPRHPLVPVPGIRGMVTLPVECEDGNLVVVMAPDSRERGGKTLRLRAAGAGVWRDFWSGKEVTVDSWGELALEAPEGVAILWGGRSMHRSFHHTQPL